MFFLAAQAMAPLVSPDLHLRVTYTHSLTYSFSRSCMVEKPTKILTRHSLRRSMPASKLTLPQILRWVSPIKLLNFSRSILLARYHVYPHIYYGNLTFILSHIFIIILPGSCVGNTWWSSIREQCHCSLW